MTETTPLLTVSAGGPSTAADNTRISVVTRVFFPRRRRNTDPSNAATGSDDDDAAATELTALEEGQGRGRRAKEGRERCFDWFRGWYRHICFSKWYKWIAYYIPILEWLPSYQFKYILGDVFAGLTLASISIPMSLSYAASLAKIQPINGLYATIAAPIVYALLGKTRRLAVLPEAALSLVVGETIRRNLEDNAGDHHHLIKSSEMACMITFLAALITFFAGIFRLGFVNVIGSPPLIRGFISGIAIVIFTEQLITELGLEDIAKLAGYSHSSAWEKAKFVYHHSTEAHRLTLLISVTAFLTLVVAKYLKENVGQARFHKNWVTLIPDILGVVALSAFLTWYFSWDEAGVKVLGQVESGSFQIRFPLPLKDIQEGKTNIRALFSSAFVVAILGYFESMAAVQYLSTADNDVSKPNRELVALGAVNGVVCTFSPTNLSLGLELMEIAFLPGLPVFGGLARSKINEYSGSKTLLSGVSLAVFTFLATRYLLKPLAWLPKASLSAVISTVSLGLLREAPKDFKYYWSMRAWTELAMIWIVITFTVFWSIDMGIYVGIGLSLLLVIKAAGNYSLRPLKLDNNGNGFVASLHEDYQFYPFVLIVNIATDSLTFVNTARIKEGLDRLERYGEFDVHPSEDRKRHPEDNVNVLFDFSLVTDIDPSAMQVLIEIVQGYRIRNTRVYFVGLIEPIRAVFTRAKIFRLLGPEEYVSPTVGECIALIRSHGGNHDEAARRANAEGRSIDAEITRWKNLE